MARSVTLVNRFPEVLATMGPKVDAAIRAGAEGIALEAQARVPVDSGDLRDAIHVERKGRGSLVVAGDHDVFYGHLVEFGTTHSPAHPFLVPALEANRETVVGLVAGALRGL